MSEHDVPAVTGAEAIRAFNKIGFLVVRISGSHHIMSRPLYPYNLSIPVHGKKIVKKGLLRAQIRIAGISVAAFRSLL